MATFTVTNLDNAGAGSLRNLIFKSNRKESADIIEFDTSLSDGTINLTSGELRIRDDLTINGLGADLLTVDAGGNSRVFNVDDGNNSNFLEVAINELTITEGNADSKGGGIFNSENLTVTNSTISGNTASGEDFTSGGGIYNHGNARVTNSIISGNMASGGDRGYGGGIGNGGDLTVSNSTISNNTAFGDFSGSGGIDNSYGSTLTVSNSTISNNGASANFPEVSGGGIGNSGTARVINSTLFGNVARDGGGIVNSGDLTVSNSTISGSRAQDGGGIDNSGYLTVTNSTLSGNTADFGGGIYNDNYSVVSNSTISGNSAYNGGGIYIYAGDVTVTSSIIAANTGRGNVTDVDIDGDPFISEGNNLIGNGDGAEGFTNGVNGDIIGTTSNLIDPLLGELQNNGGPTQTQALLPGSPAINTGSNLLNLEFDQRGPSFDRVVGAQADIGAYEVPEPNLTLGLLLGLPIARLVLIPIVEAFALDLTTVANSLCDFL